MGTLTIQNQFGAIAPLDIRIGVNSATRPLDSSGRTIRVLNRGLVGLRISPPRPPSPPSPPLIIISDDDSSDSSYCRCINVGLEVVDSTNANNEQAAALEHSFDDSTSVTSSCLTYGDNTRDNPMDSSDSIRSSTSKDDLIDMHYAGTFPPPML
ncbi:hypothetical protein PIB30_041436 [Stylosanthes scabra]|uniref:Uncharacterized protein n=1 Tax=Stylosanthes scabra TaxID=79078 RepID=A0ABU6XGM6_9FABA|nr:hypothetical protein [Stylosanthes scabra]